MGALTAALWASIAMLTPASAGAGGEVMGYWPFDGDLRDVSGAGHDAQVEGAHFAAGRKGQALQSDGRAAVIPSAAELQLSPGLVIDCWVDFDRKPEGWVPLVRKDEEYQLRVDDGREGGRFSFFVYLNGWEPRVSGPVPEPGRWYHLVARWNGSEVSLDVDGQTTSSPRSGPPKPNDKPLEVGGLVGRMDELRILNPALAQRQRLAALSSSIADADRLRQTAFGKIGGWPGWRGDLGATATVEGEVLRAKLPGEAALVFNPALDLEVTSRRFVSVDIDSPAITTANLVFVTDRGQGLAPFAVWGGKRTSIVNLTWLPQWAGRLRILGISVPAEGAHEAVVRNLWISDRPEGSPFLYVRNLAPGRAILRARREEQVLAVLRSLGAGAKDVQAELVPPRGVRVLDERVKRLPELGYDGLARMEWRVRADEPVAGPARLVLSAAGLPATETALDLRFRPSAGLPRADYVPPPKPAHSKYLNLMHYCALWKAGTHYGWGKIDPWPERRPAIGWYDEGTPEVSDWQIKYALEHGIQGFIYCWYRADYSPEIHQLLGHAIHDGLFKARYVNQFKFAIMWENGCALGVKSREDMLQNLLPFWIKTYFKHPSYVKVDNKPVLYVWQPGRVSPELGGSEATRGVLDEMREACRKAGFDGLYLVGCVGGADEHLLKQMAQEGWDASSAYGIGGPVTAPPGRDVEGVQTIPYVPWLGGEKEAWLGKKQIGALPDIVDVMMGWDPRPWSDKSTNSYVAGANPEAFRQACEEAKRVVDATPGNGLDKRIVVFDNWCEFGEGHYLEPCSGYGFGFLDAIRQVFCDDKQPCADLTPEDVGLNTPDRIYRTQREILGAQTKPRKIVGNLLAWWAFEDDDPAFAADSSGSGFKGIKNDFVSTEGIRGKAFLCRGGSVVLGPEALLFPTTGITVELWMKTDTPNQSDHWLVNTVGAANTGYRVGLGDGKIIWQIPYTDWSHLLTCPSPVPLGQWVHVAATYDNETMRVFLNGEEKASLPRGGAVIPSTAGLCLGNYGPGNSQAGFQGVLDEVKVYDRALTPEEVRKHYGELAR